MAGAGLTENHPDWGDSGAAPNPTLAYALHPAGPHPAGTVAPLIKPRIMTAKAPRRRAIKAHNRRLRARAIREHQADDQTYSAVF
jgi:hypothetical protein